MRGRSSSNGSVFVALGASVLMHALLIVPLLLAMFAAGSVTPRVEALFRSEALKSEDEEDKQEAADPVLGIERSNASTLTWIGYEEYQEHLARLSEVEQAAFTDVPTGSGEVSMETQPEAVAFLEPVELIEPEVIGEHQTEDVQNEVAAAEVEIPAETPMPVLEVPALPEIDLTAVARVLELVGLISRDRDDGENPERVEAQEEREEPAEVAQGEPADAESRASHEEHREPTELLEPTEPSHSEGPETAEAPGEPADSADKQSDATSTIEISHVHWRMGRPVAAQGVELKPMRPQFSIMQRLTSSPCNPLVEMHFNRAGTATKVALIEPSRDASIDAAVEASAYRWRAEGRAIRELDEDGTYTVRIRFILNPYARCP